MAFQGRRARSAAGRGSRPLPAHRSTTRRPGVAFRLVQYGLIPVAALLVVAWGLFGEAGMLEPFAHLGGDGGDGGRAPASDADAAAPTGSPATGIGLPPGTVAATARPATPPPGAPDGAGSGSPAPPLPTLAGTPEPTGRTGGGCAVPTDPPPARAGFYATAGTVDLWGGAGLACPVLREVRGGTPLRPLGAVVRADGVGWQLVEVEGEVGWVFAGLVEPVPMPTAAPTQPPPPPRAARCAPPAPLPPAVDPTPRVASSPLNLRDGPGLACPVLRVLAAGTEVLPRSGEVLADDRTWVLVEADGQTGWVASEFLRDSDR